MYINESSEEAVNNFKISLAEQNIYKLTPGTNGDSDTKFHADWVTTEGEIGWQNFGKNSK